MRKIMYLLALVLIISSCASYKSLDLSALTTGMTKNDVRNLIGSPDRILAVNQTDNGYQEVLEYRTSNDEVYALEFWNDYLTGYEFLYDDVTYYPSAIPPVWYPAPGMPIFPPGYYPSRPQRPNRPNRPNRPGQNNRPNPPRPSIDNSNMTRPTPGVGPSTRPTTRPTPRPSTSSPSTSSPSTRPASTPSTPDRSSLPR